MEVDFNTMLEAQAEIEVRNTNGWPKKLARFEAKLRKVILHFRNNGTSCDANEIAELIEEMAKANDFRKVEVSYERNYAGVDDHTMLAFRANLDKYECFIYVRDF